MRRPRLGHQSRGRPETKPPLSPEPERGTKNCSKHRCPQSGHYCVRPRKFYSFFLSSFPLLSIVPSCLPLHASPSWHGFIFSFLPSFRLFFYLLSFLACFSFCSLPGLPGLSWPFFFPPFFASPILSLLFFLRAHSVFLEEVRDPYSPPQESLHSRQSWARPVEATRWALSGSQVATLSLSVRLFADFLPLGWEVEGGTKWSWIFKLGYCRLAGEQSDSFEHSRLKHGRSF